MLHLLLEFSKQVLLENFNKIFDTKNSKNPNTKNKEQSLVLVYDYNRNRKTYNHIYSVMLPDDPNDETTADSLKVYALSTEEAKYLLPIPNIIEDTTIELPSNYWDQAYKIWQQVDAQGNHGEPSENESLLNIAIANQNFVIGNCHTHPDSNEKVVSAGIQLASSTIIMQHSFDDSYSNCRTHMSNIIITFKWSQMDTHIHIEKIETLTHDRGYIGEVKENGLDDTKIKEFTSKIEPILLNHVIKKYYGKGNRETCKAKAEAMATGRK